MTDPPRPIPARVVGVDVARALAILGMVIAHYTYQDGSGGLLRRVQLFVDGKAMPLFFVLGGIGCTLLLQRTERPVREILGRSAILLLLGLVMFEHVPLIAVVLHYYALMLTAGLLLRHATDRTLLVVAVSVGAVGSVTWLYLAPHLPTYTGWHGWDTLVDPWPLVASLTVSGFYPFLPSFAFFGVGLWLGRQDLSTAQARRHLALAGALLALAGYGLGTLADRFVSQPQVLVETQGTVQVRPDVIDHLARELERDSQGLATSVEQNARANEERTGQSAREALTDTLRPVEQDAASARSGRFLDPDGHSNMAPWLLGATGTSLLALALCLWFADRYPRAAAPLASAGQLALTLYVLHAVGLRWWYGGIADELSYAVELAAAFVLFGCFVAGAWAWRRAFRHGPLEVLLRVPGRVGS